MKNGYDSLEKIYESIVTNPGGHLKSGQSWPGQNRPAAEQSEATLPRFYWQA
jgi:hypothetical protein